MHFDAIFNSKNIDQIVGNQWDMVFWAGVRAEKWKANNNPAKDLSDIESIIKTIAKVQTQHFLLISTIDVYEDKSYGKNRLQLEKFVMSHFEKYTIVRLPGLFGDGLKKNALFDIMNRHRLEYINPNSKYQFYFLDWLKKDLDLILAKNLSSVDLVAEPTCIGEIASKIFSTELMNTANVPAANYNYTSADAKYWGNEKYQYSKAEVFEALNSFRLRHQGLNP